MTSPSEHPTDDELRQYLDGRLSEDRSAGIDLHLPECRQCTDFLESIGDAGQPFVELVQSAWAINESSVPQSESPLSSERETLTVGAGGSEVSGSTLPTSIDKYDVIDELGRGGMGVVYRAVDVKLKREVALKVILAGEHSSASMRTRFQREAETIARLQHPGIVQIYEVGQADSQPYLALELVPGAALCDLTLRQAQPIRWAAKMVVQLAQAVHFAHQQSIIHRDLKPGNILVVLDDEVADISSGVTNQSDDPVPTAKITDFGLAKQLDSDDQMTKTGHTLGTPAYMSPEQAAGNISDIGPAADIYALGAILYELLTGKVPIEGPDTVSTLIAVIETDPDSPREHRDEIPRDLETICMKCLMKDPEDRYETAAELAHDLELFLAGEPILARPPGMVQRLYSWARHHPQLAVCYLGCSICYALHLFAKYVLELPFHRESFGNYALIMVVSWAVLVTLCDVVSRRYDRKDYSQFAMMGLTILALAFAFSFDQGPRSAPVPILFVFIATSVLVVPRPSMIWFITATSMLAYGGMVVYANTVSRVGVITLEQAFGFLGCLMLSGVCSHLILRRASNRTIRENQWKSLRPSSAGRPGKGSHR